MRIARSLQLDVLCPNIRHDPRNEYNWWKSEHRDCQWRLGVLGCSETTEGAGVEHPIKIVKL